MNAIKIYGDYLEVRDIIMSLPKAKEGKYFYIIFSGGWTYKIGVTENPAKRILNHEMGFKRYANTHIKYILLTNICLEYDKLEAKVKTAMAINSENDISEWGKADDILKIYDFIFPIFKHHKFIEVQSHECFTSVLIKRAELYFQTNPNENEISINEEEIKEILKQTKIKCSTDRAYKALKFLSKNNSELVCQKNKRDFTLQRQIIHTDVKQMGIDRN